MKRRYLFPLLIVAAVVVILASQFPKLYIATGYGAKCMATAVFVAGRDPESAKALDLNYSIVKYTTSTIDYQKKSVTTSFWGVAEQTAVYRDGLGCTLLGDANADLVQKSAIRLPKIDPLAWKREWPAGDQVKDTVFAEIDTEQLKSAINLAFDYPDQMEKQTAAVVVLYKGKIVGEKYWSEVGITSETPLWGWSMNKSIINALVGLLVKEGKLDVTALAPVPEWLNDKRRDIRINDLMQMSSGLKWDENYSDVSNATKMLYRSADSYQVAISAPFEKAPQKEWKYSSGTSNILSGIIRNTINNDSIYHLYPYERLFRKIGMNSFLLETDAAGTFVGSSYGYATARDWARFGLLYAQNGIWQNDTLFVKGWVDYTRNEALASEGKYGAQFWLNKAKTLPDVPEDMFACEGHRGQRVFIIPSRNLVIVRLGFSEKEFDHNLMLKNILNAFQ